MSGETVEAEGLSDAGFLDLAVTEAARSARTGGGPFGAVAVADDGYFLVRSNAVTRNLDPTAHAEMEAIRAIAEVLGRFELRDVTVYSSCAPCPMCLSAAMWARIPRIVYAATPEDAADAGFSDSVFYRQLGTVSQPPLALGPHRGYPVGPLSFANLTLIDVEYLATPNRREPFDVWTSLPELERVEY